MSVFAAMFLLEEMWEVFFSFVFTTGSFYWNVDFTNTDVQTQILTDFAIDWSTANK